MGIGARACWTQPLASGAKRLADEATLEVPQAIFVVEVSCVKLLVPEAVLLLGVKLPPAFYVLVVVARSLESWATLLAALCGPTRAEYRVRDNGWGTEPGTLTKVPGSRSLELGQVQQKRKAD